MSVQRSIAALLILGVMVPATGQPPPVDRRLEQAVAWYTGTAGRMDDERAHQMLLEALTGGGALPQMWLARSHSRGRMGFARDPARASTLADGVISEIRQMAEAGVTEAIFLMGTAYDEGLAVAPDAVQAAVWFRRAADRGHILAQHNLGNAYADGRGVAQDDAMAINWWRKAADAGDTVPQFRLAQMYQQGRGIDQDLASARRWYQRAAARGYAPAVEAVDRLVPWTAAGIKSGVTLAYRDDTAVDAREVRATVDLPFAATQVFEVVCDQTRYQSLVPGLEEVRLLSGTVPDKYELYFRYAPQFAVVAARDVAVRVQSTAGVPGCRWWHLPGRVARQAGVVRMPFLRGSWSIDAIEAGRSRVIYQVTADPGGRLPAWLVRRDTLGTLPDVIERVRQRLQREHSGKE